MKAIESIRDITAQYDAFLIDLWGVMHDGSSLYPKAKEAIAYLHEAGKKVIFLSNAPRKATRAEATLLALGIAREQFLEVVTSGQVAYDRLEADRSIGHCYYYLGPGKDEEVLLGLEGYWQTKEPDEADFILNTGFEFDYQPEAEIEPLLQDLLAHELPLLCVNPDIEVVKQDGTRLLCAGWVAARYEELGGKVDYIGKPHPLVYAHCFQKLGNPAKVLAIGDNLLTDIAGANAMGIDSLLITGGIMKSEQGHSLSDEEIDMLCKKASATPTYVAELFAA